MVIDMTLSITKIESVSLSKADYNSKHELVKFPKSSSLKLKLSGNDVTTELLNAIRRAVLMYIPMYAFAPEMIDIKINTTNINNDMIRLRISQLPLFDIPLTVDYLDEKYWNNYTKDMEHHEDADKIDLYIKAKNTSNGILNVTSKSSEVEFHINDKLQKNYDKLDPILIVQMSPHSELICHAKAVVGIGYKNDIWSSGTCYYYDDNQHYYLIVKSNGQYDEKNIIIKACKYLLHNLKLINEKIKKISYPSDRDKFIVVLEDEDFTCANLINYFMQDDEAVNFAGITKENHNINNITFKIETTKLMTIGIIFENAIKKSSALIKKFEDRVQEI